jgi:GNAT superfamily N-acetyltransferase
MKRYRRGGDASTMADTQGDSRAVATRRALEIVEMPLGDPRLKEFVRFPYRLYRGDPYWTPQLDADLLGNKLLGMQGLLTPDHPYHQTAKATHFMAFRDGRPVGRVSAVVNERIDEGWGGKFGFFGFFEVIEEYAVAEKLLDAARDWCKAHGAKILRGPGEYSNITHERQACLIEGFDQDVYVEHTYNPPFYAEFIERYGFKKTKDYVAYLIDLTKPANERLTRVAGLVRKRGGITTRCVVMKNLEAEVKLILEIYNQAWAENWGFLPITDWEADILVEALRPILDVGLIRFAYHDGKPIAVLGCFPDPNVALRPRWKWYGDSDYVRLARLLTTPKPIPRVRLMFFGVLPGYRGLGTDALLFEEVLTHSQKRGYHWCDTSLLLENKGGHEYKKWRIFDLPLD